MRLPFDLSRHKLLPLYWATEEGFELSLPLSDLSEQSLLIGTIAVSPLQSWIKRKRENPRSLFSCLNICETAVHQGKEGRKDISDLMLELSGFAESAC